MAEQMEPWKDEIIKEKADILGESGDIDGAIREWSRCIELNPDDFGAYYRRGFFEDNSGRYEDALIDYDMSTKLNPNHAYSYLGKADMLMKLGKNDEAMTCYRKVVEIDTIPDDSPCAMYAYLALGDKEAAINFLNRAINQDPESPDRYYDAACIYGRIGDQEKSLEYLERALAKGFVRFSHIRIDDDLDLLHELPQFEQLIQKYEKENSEQNEKNQHISISSTQV